MVDKNQDSFEMERRYRRAQRFMLGVSNRLVLNDTIFPHWNGKTDCFWYERFYQDDEPVSKLNQLEIYKEYRLVNCKKATNKKAFDHEAFADALAREAKTEVNHKDLPISDLSIAPMPLDVEFTAFGKRWRFCGADNTCLKIPEKSNSKVTSPDGRWIVFTRNYNLWLRDISSGEERSLTQDGEEFYAYAANSLTWTWPIDGDPQAIWSPDSKMIFTLQRDTRNVKTSPVVHHVPKNGSLRPYVENVKVAYPGDEHVQTYRLLCIDVESGRVCEADYHQITSCATGASFFSSNLGWWANDSRRAYFIDLNRSHQSLRVVQFDAVTGVTNILFEETSETYININLYTEDKPAHIYLADTNELVWPSERNGWAHLYLYDLETGLLKNQITGIGGFSSLEKGWRVRDILHFDKARRELFIQTAGRDGARDPYYRDICRVSIDSGDLKTLRSSDQEYLVLTQGSNYLSYGGYFGWGIDEHLSGVSPSGNYLVTTVSRVDQRPQSLLLDREGNVVLELEVANTDNLPSDWQWPEPFKFIAADGKTDLYGVMYRPSDFDPDKHYPVINFMTSSPLVTAVPKGSFFNGKAYAGFFYLQAAALAELGFIVVQIDSRGTALRSKSFQDHSYGWMAAACDTEDHIAGVQQLAKRYPAMDLDRVGIYNPSGYQGGIENLFIRTDFYTVGVIDLLQDARMMPATLIGDKCEGEDGPCGNRLYPEQMVDGFVGKLLLSHPMLDSEHLAANTFRIVEALQKANKDFDLILLPNLGHGFSSYQIRRCWDFLVKNLLDTKPPNQFKLVTAFDSGNVVEKIQDLLIDSTDRQKLCD